jgi:hypothetical protein
MEALVLVKCLDEKSQVTWLFRTTHDLNLEELLGALIVHADVIRQKLSNAWMDE